MKPIYYIIAVDIAIIIVMIRLIFGSYKVFFNSLADHIFPGDVLPNPLDNYAEKHDTRHKMNVLYAVILFLAGVTFFGLYYLVYKK